MYFSFKRGTTFNAELSWPGFFPAYSGNSGHNRNNPDAVSTPEVGPLPPGLYYIVTRPRGGLATHWHDVIKEFESGSNRDYWFALYRHDNHIDDTTFMNRVERGSFRLHPAGQSGISNGCITLPNHAHFRILMHGLLASGTIKVAAGLNALGTIQVY